MMDKKCKAGFTSFQEVYEKGKAAMEIVFMGTPDFSVPTLQALVSNDYRVKAVVTQPDRPKGRGRKILAPPVKILAQQYNIPVLQPPKIHAAEIREHLQEIAPDAIVVIAYGQILPESILRIPRSGCLNVHASLLPKYRGAAPIQWAIIRGEQETGITTMLMDTGIDTGDILLQQRVPIMPDDTAGTLYDTLARVGADVLVRTLLGVTDGSAKPIPQNHAKATYAPLLKKEEGLIDWHDSAVNIHNKVRGMFPWPGAYTYFQGKTVKVLQVMAASGEVAKCSFLPGTVVALDNTDGPVIATGDGLIRILEIQPENRKPMRCNDFCRGYHLTIGDRLTE